MLKRTLSLLAFFPFLLGGMQPLAGQNTFPDLKKGFENYAALHPVEKLYAHLDQTAYLAGETLWFSLYAVQGANHQLMPLSRVAYLEMLDTSGKSVLQAKVPLENGRGNGSLFLPASLPTGHYVVRAYTQWMRNFGEAYFFEQPVTLYNTFATIPQKNASAAKANLQFFPEGGALLEGVPNKVGVKITGPDGLSLPVAHMHVLEGVDTLATTSPWHQGMASFQFVPEPGKDYQAVLALANGQTLAQPLPPAAKNGVSMKVQATGEQLKIEAFVKIPGMARIYLLAHQQFKGIVAQEAAVTDGKAVFTLPTAPLAAGITHLTLLGEDKLPMAERLFFKRPSEPMPVTASLPKQQFLTREQVEVALEAASPSYFSLSVFRVDSLAHYTQQDLHVYLHLLSDVQGVVENPAYYLEAGHENAADDLMLTQGWRKLNWEKVWAEKDHIIDFLPEARYPMVRARVTLKGTDVRPVSPMAAYLSIPGRNPHFHGGRTRPGTGEVYFEIERPFYGERQLILQTAPHPEETYQVTLLSPFVSTQPVWQLPDFQPLEHKASELLARSIHMQVRASWQPLPAPEEVTARLPAFYGTPDQRFRLDDYTRFPVMEEVMREYVSNVQVRKRRGKFHFMVLNQPYNSIFQTDPLVLYDGVPIFDLDQVMAVNPRKVETLEVMARKYHYGPLSFSGIVNYQTYQGDLDGLEVSANALMTTYQGLQVPKTFYSPDHGTSPVPQRVADLRQLLFWLPDGSTVGKGNQTVRFYTSDLEGTYMGIARFLSATGESGTVSFSFQVAPKGQ